MTYFSDCCTNFDSKKKTKKMDKNQFSFINMIIFIQKLPACIMPKHFHLVRNKYLYTIYLSFYFYYTLIRIFHLKRLPFRRHVSHVCMRIRKN